MKNIHHSFSSLHSLLYLHKKINFLFHTQEYLKTILQTALENSSMVGVLGREGMGKSSAIADFVHHHPQIYYVRIGQSYRVTNFMDDMLFQVSGEYPSSEDSLFVKVKMLSSLLTQSDLRKLIIVDDAGKLSPRGLGFFQELRDNTITCTGFVFVGLPYFRENLESAIRRGVVGVAEFHRRIEAWYTIPGLRKKEIPQYGASQGLTAEQLTELCGAKIETIAQLEHYVNKLKRAASDTPASSDPQANPGAHKTVGLSDDTQEKKQEMRRDKQRAARRKFTKQTSYS